MVKKLLNQSSFGFALLIVCSYLQVWGQKANMPTNAELYQLAKNYITSPVRKIESPNSEIWFQRDLSAYLYSMEHPAEAIQQDTDKVRIQALAGGGACLPDFTEVDDEYPLRSMRGAWITSVFNLDWPTNRTASTATQRAQLISQLDLLKNAGFNTVFLQVRTGSDALYQSAHEPWSFYLTGTEGLAGTYLRYKPMLLSEVVYLPFP